MSYSWSETQRTVQQTVIAVLQGLVILIAVGLIAACLLAACGALPWPQIDVRFGAVLVPQAGLWAQLSVTGLFIALCCTLPANARMARLERSHRNFAMGMEDVAQAYRVAHAADRAGVFALSGEFETMRARLEHLRQHPDLAHLEPELLQLAAQMSLATRDLARAYSDDKVARARVFLQQRQHEAHSLTDRLAIARRTCDELRRWLTDIEAEERRSHVQIRRLEADLKEILPTLGYAFDQPEPSEANVVTLPKQAGQPLTMARETHS